MNPNPGLFTTAVALLAVGGQVANLILNLKIRNGQLETERRILAEVADKYANGEACEAEMCDHERRISRLERTQERGHA